MAAPTLDRAPLHHRAPHTHTPSDGENANRPVHLPARLWGVGGDPRRHGEDLPTPPRQGPRREFFFVKVVTKQHFPRTCCTCMHTSTAALLTAAKRGRRPEWAQSRTAVSLHKGGF